MTDPAIQALARAMHRSKAWPAVFAAGSAEILAAAALKVLNLTPEAAAALMDGTAVVVPVKPTSSMLEAANEANSQDWNDETDPLYISETTRCIYDAAISAAPYRSNSDGS